MQRSLLHDLESPRGAFEHAIATHSQTLGQFFLAKFLGLHVSYDSETCIVEFGAREYLQNPRGTLQGGVIATALDISMGHLVQHLCGAAATVDIQIQYHRAVSEGAVRCVAGVTHRGSKLWFMNATARTESGNLIASATSTFMRLER